MGHHIPFGEPQNQSERWAFAFLEKHLPDEIEILTNIEVLSERGQPFEVDAIVLGPWAIHFIDVKGYSGSVSAGKDVWELDGRPVENPLPKANHVARMFAGRLGRRAPKGTHMPWCQGGAFLTGMNGRDLSLTKLDPELCVWGPQEIVSALTTPRFVTSHKQFEVTPAQWSLARDVAGQTEAVLRRQNTIGDFQRTKRIHQHQGLEVWLANYKRGEYERRFLLKIIDPSGFNSALEAHKAMASLRTEAGLYMELSGLAGIPYVAPLIDTGELLALPIRLPEGKSLTHWKPEGLELELRLRILRSAGAALQGIHNRGLCHGRLRPESIFITGSGDVELLDIAGKLEGDPLEDTAAFAAVFNPWFDESVPRITTWLKNEHHDLESLRAAIILSLDPQTATLETEPIQVCPGSVIADHFRLVEEYRHESEMSSWRARHEVGRFDCAVVISEQGQEGFQRIRSEFEILGKVFHPNVCRVFEAGSLDENRHYLARAWAEGRSLRGIIRDEGAVEHNFLLKIVRQAASALQYLHRSGITHRNIRPKSMIVNDDNLILIDLGMNDPEDTRAGALAFRDPRVIEEGWSEQSDLYSLTIALMCAASGTVDPPLSIENKWQEFKKSAMDGLPAKLLNGIEQSLRLFPGGLPENYLEFYGISEEEEQLAELPDNFRKQWGISKGYMEFLTVDMLNDGRARSRQQWVLNTLRSRRISGNKINKGSMNSTVSRLFSSGIAEKYGKKVRLTNGFIQSWNDFE